MRRASARAEPVPPASSAAVPAVPAHLGRPTAAAAAAPAVVRTILATAALLAPRFAARFPLARRRRSAPIAASAARTLLALLSRRAPRTSPSAAAITAAVRGRLLLLLRRCEAAPPAVVARSGRRRLVLCEAAVARRYGRVCVHEVGKGEVSGGFMSSARGGRGRDALQPDIVECASISRVERGSPSEHWRERKGGEGRERGGRARVRTVRTRVERTTTHAVEHSHSQHLRQLGTASGGPVRARYPHARARVSRGRRTRFVPVERHSTRRPRATTAQHVASLASIRT